MAQVKGKYVEQLTACVHTDDTAFSRGDSALLPRIAKEDLLANTEYLIIAQGVISGNGVNNNFQCRVQTDDEADIAAKSTMRIEPQNDVRGLPYFFVHSFETGATPDDIDLEIQTETSGQIVTMDQSSLKAVNLDDMPAGSFFQTIHADPGEGVSEFPLTQADAFTIAGSNLGTDEWLVLACLRGDLGATNVNHRVEAFAADDTSTAAAVATHEDEPEDGNNFQLFGFKVRHKASSGTPNFSLQTWEETGNANVHDRGGYAIAIKAAAFESIKFAYTAGTTTIDSTERTMQTESSYSPTTTADHMFFGSFNRTARSGSSVTKIHIEDDDVEMRTGDEATLTQQMYDSTSQPTEHIGHEVNILSSDTSTYTLRASIASGSDPIEHRWLIIWSMELASAGPDPIDLTHLANTAFPTPTVASSSFQMTTLQSTTLFSMQLDGEIVLGHLANTTIFSPTLTSTIDLAHLANTTFFSPQLDGTIDLALLSSTTFPTPHVLSVLDMALLSGTVFFSPQLDGNIDLALLSSTVFPVIQLDGEILLTHLASTTFPAFFVDGNIDLAHLANTTFFSPQLDGEILLTHLAGTNIFSITVVSGAGPEPLDMDLLSSTVLSSIFLDGNIDLTHLANTTFFSPQLDGTIDLAHLAGTVIPSITVGEANIDLAHLSTTTLFSMNVDGNIDLAHLNSTVIFSTNVAGSSIDLAHLSSTTIFTITVVDPAAAAVGIQLPMRGVDR